MEAHSKMVSKKSASVCDSMQSMCSVHDLSTSDAFAHKTTVCALVCRVNQWRTFWSKYAVRFISAFVWWNWRTVALKQCLWFGRCFMQTFYVILRAVQSARSFLLVYVGAKNRRFWQVSLFMVLIYTKLKKVWWKKIARKLNLMAPNILKCVAQGKNKQTVRWFYVLVCAQSCKQQPSVNTSISSFLSSLNCIRP